MNKNKMELELAPLRSINDFLLESARFQIPNFRDLDKWEKRVVNNLMYYQTNYFLTACLIFLAVGVLHPVQMLSGMFSVTVAFAVFYYFTMSAKQFKRNYPFIGVILVLGAAYFGVYVLGAVAVFLLGILLPILAIFLHASMRLRNLKNKFVNKIETIGIKRSPMGIFLEAIDESIVIYNR